MRPFDIIGILVVAIWIGSVGAFLWIGEERQEAVSLGDSAVELQEETLWMAVYRDGEETGMLREDRTRLIDGWLVELQGIVELEMMEERYGLRFSSRTTLDESLELRSATGTVEAFGMELGMNGRFSDADGDAKVHVNINLEDSTRQFVADVKERPRLATHAIAEILATEELSEGDRFEQEFFDPLTLSPTQLEITYEGREWIDTVDGNQEAYDFVQSVGDIDTRVFTDSRGRILSQALPMGIVVRQIPSPIGPSQFQSAEERIEDAVDASPPFVGSIDTDDLLAVVARFGSGEVDRLEPADDLESLVESTEPGTETREYRLDDLTDGSRLNLVAPRQHVAIQTDESARVEAGVDNRLWNPGYAPENSEYQPVSTADDHDTVSAMVAVVEDAIDDDELDIGAIAGAADFCDIDPAADPGIDAHAAWPEAIDDEPSTPLHCLAAIADALHAADMPPHLVHGVYASDGNVVPHLWLAIYRDGTYVGAIDPTVDGGALTHRHLQLFVDDHYRPERLRELVDRVEPQ